MTLKEIAAKAGVSVATVSYVLNGNPRVAKETRLRVEAVIKETGYRSNFFAQSLRRGRTFLIGVIVEDITVYHTPLIIDGINSLAEKKGYQIILCNLRLLSKIESQFEHISQYQKDIDRAVDTLSRMRADGIIYVGMHDRAIRNVLDELHKPVIYCYCYTPEEGSSVRYSNEKASARITQLFLKRGHREFAVIQGLEGSEPAALRMKGVEQALRDAGVALKPENVVRGDWKYAAARAAALQLLARPDRPTAVIAMNDEMAIGARDAAAQLGLRVPEDVSISGFDNSDIVQYVTPHLTTVERPLQEMGLRSMEILLDKIENGHVEDVNITLPCRIVEGETIADVPQKGKPCNSTD